MSDGKRILAVFAHPDDECYGPGGTIARYARDGVEVYLLMFTCGEAGSIGVSRTMHPEELCRKRTRELADACDALGVREHRLVGVPDGKVSSLDVERAVGEIVRDIEKYRPEVVMTFHHLGVSGHPDHIAITKLLARAYEQSPSVKKMYEWGIPQEKSRLYERPNLKPMPADQVTTVIDIPEEAMDRKIAAIACHVTQFDFYESLRAKFDYRSVSAPECFYLRASRLPPPSGQETDFFHDL